MLNTRLRVGRYRQPCTALQDDWLPFGEQGPDRRFCPKAVGRSILTGCKIKGNSIAPGSVTHSHTMDRVAVVTVL
jgi:hypothetical protein